MTELNFDRYQILKLAEMPKVETVIVPSYDFWGGVGEPTICVVTPAVLNAIFAATGKPVRSLPLKNVKLVERGSSRSLDHEIGAHQDFGGKGHADRDVRSSRARIARNSLGPLHRDDLPGLAP
jgi:hypothetical protein